MLKTCIMFINAFKLIKQEVKHVSIHTPELSNTDYTLIQSDLQVQVHSKRHGPYSTNDRVSGHINNVQRQRILQSNGR